MFWMTFLKRACGTENQMLKASVIPIRLDYIGLNENTEIIRKEIRHFEITTIIIIVIKTFKLPMILKHN